MFQWQSMTPRKRRLIVPTIILGSLVSLAVPTAARAQCPSLWIVNGSTVCLTTDGARRTLRYENPRAGMRDEGVKRGTLLFEGRVDGDRISGTAYVFSGRCDRAFPYPVTGEIIGNSRTIVLSGRAVARLNRDCRVTGYRHDVQQVHLVHTTEPMRTATVVTVPSDAAEQRRRFSAVLGEVQTCLSGDLAACDRATSHEVIAPEDRARIADMRHRVRAAQAEQNRLRRDLLEREAQARQDHEAARRQEARDHARLALETDMERCLAGKRPACTTALASSQITGPGRVLVERRIAELDAPRSDRLTGQPWHVALTAWIETGPLAAVSPAQILAWLIPMLVLGLVTTAVIVVWKRRIGFAGAAALWTAIRTFLVAALASRQRAEPSQPAAEPPPQAATGAVAPSSPTPPPPAPTPAVTTVAPSQPQQPAKPRDTPAALAAMELAFAYLEEVQRAPKPGLEDTVLRKELLNSLSLATRQLEAASTHDPDAILETTDSDGDAIRCSIEQLKSEVLLTEGRTHMIYDVRRALPALDAATRHDPQHAVAFYTLGLAQAANMNRGPAIEAFEHAVALEPTNIQFRLELDRARNLSGAEVAAYKATRAAENVYDAGIKVANAGVRVYNVGVVMWNIFAITWNTVTFPMRMVLKFVNMFDRAGRT